MYANSVSKGTVQWMTNGLCQRLQCTPSSRQSCIRYATHLVNVRPLFTESSHSSEQTNYDAKRNHRSSRDLEGDILNLLASAENGRHPLPVRRQARRRIAPSTKIRESLKEWSAQATAIKKQSTPSTIPAEGKIFELPNNLFVGRQEIADDVAPQDIASAENHNGVHSDWLAGSHHLIQPGTLLRIRLNTATLQYAVYIGDLGAQSLLALEDGSWAVQTLRPMRNNAVATYSYYHVRDFLSAIELDELTRHLPRESIRRASTGSSSGADIDYRAPIPLAASRPLMRQIKSFKEEVENLEMLFATDIRTAYDRVAHETQHQTLSVSEFLFQGADIRYEKLSEPAKMAVITQLTEFDHISVFNAAETVSLVILPKSLVKDLQSVVKWARDYQNIAAQAANGEDVTTKLNTNPLNSFIEKARSLITSSREMHLPTPAGSTFMGPLSSEHNQTSRNPIPRRRAVSFTDDDRKFIDFIWLAACQIPVSITTGSLKLGPITCLILRAIGAYPDLTLDLKAARLLLREMGCIDPWTMRAKFDLSIPHPGGLASQRADRLEEELEGLRKEFVSPMYQSKVFELDSMSHLRRDWGPLPAFVIDGQSDTNADDAISFEAAQDMPGCYWIHIHASHISAFYGPDSIIGRSARHHGSTCFVPDFTVARDMLPEVFQKRFQIKRNAAVLTTSTLIDHEGSVVDVKMSAGILRNVIKVHREALADLLDLPKHSGGGTSTFVVGEWYSHANEVPPDEDGIAYRETFHTLYKIFEKRLANRLLEAPGHTDSPGYKFDVMVRTTPLPRLEKDRIYQSKYWTGEPSIEVSAKTPVKHALAAGRITDLVAQAMRLAAESAGLWLRTRSIPAVYLGTSSTAQVANSSADVALAPFVHMRSATPVPHWKYFMKQYTCVTSPMRRFQDLLNHYQIDSYLRAEADGRLSPGSPVEDQSLLAYSQADIENYLKRDASTVDTVDQVSRMTVTNLVMHALFRAFHFQQASLPEEWEVMIEQPATRSATGAIVLGRGVLFPFNLPCILLPSTAGWENQAGRWQFLKVRLNTIDPEATTVFCTAIATPTAEPTLMPAPELCKPSIHL